MSEPLDLGLFPLDLVLLPGERAPLHLFEPRYRQLYADCTLDDRPFVVVHASAAGTAPVGCTARFETLVHRFDDGRLNVIVRGIGPVRILDETDGRLYLSAQVEALEDTAGAAAPELVADALGRFRALAGAEADTVPEAPEGVALSYAIASLFELPPGPKQNLLESRDETERLTLLIDLLGDVAQEMEHARIAAHRAGSNGRVTTP